jgi:hypothetical protein
VENTILAKLLHDTELALFICILHVFLDLENCENKMLAKMFQFSGTDKNSGHNVYR